MKEVALPSGIKVKVSVYDEDELLIEFSDPKIEGVVHKMRVPKYKEITEGEEVKKIPITPEDLDEYINRYLYGYTDESGEHVKGYYELIEERRKKLEEEQKQNEVEWWS